MSKIYVMGKHYHRLVPCPSYEVTKIETWLSNLAEEGLFLTNDGIFAGIATFEYKGPQKARYRLEAAQKNTGMWADNGGDPDPEQIEISEKYSWEYVAKLRDFYIYRSFDIAARELNTDPEVQAMALNAVKKRARSSLFSSLFWLLVYPIVLTRGCILLTTAAMGTVWMLLAFILGVLLVVGDIRAFVHLKRMQQSLQREGYYHSDSDWKKERGQYFARKITVTVLGIFLVCTLIRIWGGQITDENKIPLREYQGTIPFATIKEFAGDGYSDYILTMSGMASGINTIEERNDWIAPRYISYDEYAEIKRADGQIIDGGLFVEYWELRNPTLARLCVKEVYRLERTKLFKMRSKNDPLETPELDADFAVAYRNEGHFPTIVIQKGNVVIRAYFFQSASHYQMPFEEWAKIICDSINN